MACGIAYHGVLAKMGIRPHRPLERDMQLTGNITAYAGSGRTMSPPPRRNLPAGPVPSGVSSPPALSPAEDGGDGQAPADYPTTSTGLPDFAKMTPAQRLAHHRSRLDAMFR